MARVLVLDGGSQAALSVVRSLGDRGVSVTVGADSRLAPGLYSRYADERYRYPPAERDGERFVAHLEAHLAERSYTAVFAVTDATSVLLARHRERLAATGTTVAVEDWPTFRRANDKRALSELVGELDVPAPETRVPETTAELAALAADVTYPVVVKPRSKSVWDGEGTLGRFVVDDDNYAADPAGLHSTYRELLDRYGPEMEGQLLVQEYVPGTTTTTVVLADEGDVRLAFQEERLRTYPASGGNSALLGALREPRMLAHATRVIEALEWTGPAMVEFMRTPDGEFYVVEVNGRYWGSLPFAAACGVDFPWRHYQLLTGNGTDLGGPTTYRTDVRGRRLLYEDVLWLGDVLSDGDVGALGTFLASFLTTDHLFVSTDDPVPTAAALAEVPWVVAGWLRDG